MGKSKKLPKTLTADQVKALKAQPNVKCPTGLRNRAILEVMHGCGLRVSEVCALQLGHVDLDAGLLTVRQGKGKKDRVVPLHDAQRAWVVSWLGKRPQNAGKAAFCTLQGKPLSVRYVQAAVARLAAKAEIGHVTPHMLRHTYATELLDEGFSIRDVQELLGHSSVMTTQVYTHVNPVELIRKIKARGVKTQKPVEYNQAKATAQALLDSLPDAVRSALASMV